MMMLKVKFEIADREDVDSATICHLKDSRYTAKGT